MSAVVGHRTSSDYSANDRLRVLKTCRVVADILGELTEHVTVVGGIVPTLLTLSQDDIEEQHVGSTDLDIAITLVADAGLKAEVISKLEDVGFEPASREDGGKNDSRWTHPDAKERVHIDIIPVAADGAGVTGRLSEVRFALSRRRRVRLGDAHELWVCAPGPYVLLKTAAFMDRTEPKDAYDLCFVLEHCSTDEIVHDLAPLMREPEAAELMAELKHLFIDEDAEGPQAVARFLGLVDDDVTLTEAVGLVLDLCAKVGIT